MTDNRYKLEEQREEFTAAEKTERREEIKMMLQEEPPWLDERWKWQNRSQR